MKTLTLILLMVSTSAFAGNNNPMTIATHYYDALKANNITEARKYISDKKHLPDDGSTSFDIKNYRLAKTTIDKNTAAIGTTIINDKSTLTFNTSLEKIHGAWKVNFQKSTINMMRSALSKGKVKVNGKVELHPAK